MNEFSCTSRRFRLVGYALLFFCLASACTPLDYEPPVAVGPQIVIDAGFERAIVLPEFLIDAAGRMSLDDVQRSSEWRGWI